MVEKDKESSGESRSEMYGIVEESALAYIANLRHSVANEPIASTRLRHSRSDHTLPTRPIASGMFRLPQLNILDDLNVK